MIILKGKHTSLLETKSNKVHTINHNQNIEYK